MPAKRDTRKLLTNHFRKFYAHITPRGLYGSACFLISYNHYSRYSSLWKICIVIRCAHRRLFRQSQLALINSDRYPRSTLSFVGRVPANPSLSLARLNVEPLMQLNRFSVVFSVTWCLPSSLLPTRGNACAMRNRSCMSIAFEEETELQGCSKAVFSTSDVISGHVLVRMGRDTPFDELSINFLGMYLNFLAEASLWTYSLLTWLQSV